MQYVDENNDELMRRAAEQYPLNTDGADWDALQHKMQAGDDDKTAAIVLPGKPKRRRYLWLLLVIPATALLFKLANNTVKQKANNTVGVEKKLVDSQPAVKENRTELNNNQVQPVIAEKKQEAESVIINNKQKDAVEKTTVNKEKAVNSGVAVLQSNKQRVIETHQNNELQGNKQTPPALQNDNILTGKNKIEDGKQSRNDQQNLAQKNSSNADEKKQQQAETSAKQKIIDSATATAKQSAANKKEIKKNSVVQPFGLYAGLAAGLDVSTVKLQRVKSAGYSLSILLGYKLSKHVSLETGFMLDQKKYYSKGDYFDIKRTGLPPGDKVIFLDGVCNMFEIPINVKYDFSSKKKGNFFAISGLSTYIMKKEKYNYYANWQGSYYYGNKQYKSSGTNALSVLNLGAGYQFNLPKATSIRIEPYLKIPLSGIGIGSLPLTSAGLSVGITKSFK